MQLSTFFLAAAATLASAGQVNFYSDSNCQNYLDHRFPGSFSITGGPAGSKSALWVSADQAACSSTCGPLIICGDAQCNNRKRTGLGQCVGFSSGVWAENGCGQNYC